MLIICDAIAEVCNDDREVRAKEKKEDRNSPFTKGVTIWQSGEPEEEKEKLDPNNRFLEDMWKRKSEK